MQRFPEEKFYFYETDTKIEDEIDKYPEWLIMHLNDVSLTWMKDENRYLMLITL